jgi:hypothetical protein
MAGMSRMTSAIAVAAVAVLTVASCTGHDDSGDDRGDDAGPETLAPIPVEATIPGGTLTGGDSASITAVLADDVVTAEELAASYDAYVECLAGGGGSGRYAFDVELRTGLVVDWNVDDEPAALDRDVLSADCSRRFLGDLTRRFESGEPVPDDLAARQHTSIAACVEAVSPTAAANLPAQISVGTGGEAVSLSELQIDPVTLDPATLGSNPDDAAAVADCITAVGAEWRRFG